MASIPKVDSKDPTEVLDYQIDMTTELKGRGVSGADDYITAVTWVVPADLTMVGSAHDNNLATVILAGGSLGQQYTISAEITTFGSRTYHRSFRVRIETR